ncbi:cation-translocating P-type ATPase [Arachnia propionica]|uniref:Cation-translocating P-type ATPase n=1 Tax=Arachnia propionica TaxID=1750 RepID=A0A3P1WW48_9ACTN|nr:cation-translocating P-type ATPase [Arachnia propionica]RRD50789.1 cation-translocating P-type ATPase [Arachnia propionica]
MTINTTRLAEPHRLEVDAVLTGLDVDPARGLDVEVAAARLAADGPNELRAKPPVPLWRRILAQFRDPLVTLLLVAMAISLVAWIFEGGHGAPIDVIVIGAIVVLNAAIGLVQEGRAEQAVAALARMTAATSTVLRGGQQRVIPSSELVRGDLLLLAEGDAVGADARLIQATGLKVQEASLTGESEAVDKDPAVIDHPVAVGDRANMVFKGTAVVHGVGRAVVTDTGMDTQMGTIATLLDETETDPSPLDREVASLTRMLGLVVLGIAAVVMVVLFLLNRPGSVSEAVEILLIGVSLAVAAVPEGLPAILSMVLAIGVQQLAARRAVMKDLHSVETLGSASVICSDKTGTLTRNEMTIRVIATASGEVELSGTGYSPEGEVLGDPAPAALLEVTLTLAGGAVANNAGLARDDDGNWGITGDPTEAAFLVAQHKVQGLVDRVAAAERQAEVPFSSERKLMSVLAAHPELAAPRLITKGAPDVLLERCVARRVGTEVVPLDDEARREITATVERLNSHGYRSLGVAYREVEALEVEVGPESEQGLVLVGVVGIIDPARDEARDAVAAAHRAGIRVVMITGDHPVTAARIAADLGIVAPGAPALTGADLDSLDEQGFAEAVARVSVFARVAPEHKIRIVDALQRGGQVVAMTGDGVNDAPALKSADIGVAMGITGTEVTKEAGTMILGDDNFATIVAAVRQGRGIFDNIKKFMRYLLSSNMGEVVTVFLGIVLAGVIGLSDAAAGSSLAVPLLVAQILWINLVTDSGPALAMGVDPEDGDVMARPPRHPGERIVDKAMWRRIVFTGVVMGLVTLFALDLSLPGGLVPGGTDSLETARTMAFTTLVFMQLFNAFNSRSEDRSAFNGLFSNGWLWLSVVVAALLQVAVVHVPLLQTAFGTVALDGHHWLLAIGLGSVVLWAEEIAKLVRRLRR